MRKLFISSILVLSVCAATFAQTNEKSPCPIPKIEISSPAGITKPDEPIIFTASISNKDEKSNLTYNWVVIGGEIIAGQGTLTLKVLPENSRGKHLTVTVEISNFSNDCPNPLSETLTLIADPAPPEAVKVDEFSVPVSKIANRKSDKLIKAAQDNPLALLYVFVGYREKPLTKARTKKEREILNLLIKENGISADRITIVRVISDEELTQFWIVPVGATIPEFKNSI